MSNTLNRRDTRSVDVHYSKHEVREWPSIERGKGQQRMEIDYILYVTTGM